VEAGRDDVVGMRRLVLAVTTFLALLVPGAALAGGGSYVFDGGTAAERSQVRAALDASSFDWGLIPQTIRVHIGLVGDSYSTPGDVYLDGRLLRAGRFSWGTVQHEFGHQVDFFLLDDAKRATLNTALGGQDWCYSVPNLAHSDHGCERFASELSWAYWPSADNAMKPSSSSDEAGAIPSSQFRALLAQMIGAPNTVSTNVAAKAYAPKTKTKR
jgi:hypothetical protein